MSTPTCNAGYVIPGPTGPAGTNGTNGTNGISAGSITTADFVMPLVAAPVTVDVDQHVWMSGGSWVFVQGAGGFLVFGFIGPTQVVLINAGWPGNAAPATNISLGKVIAPSGPMGPTGATGAPGAGGTVLPTTTKGDLPVDNGVPAHPNPQRLAASPDLSVLHADSTQPLGLRYSGIDLTGVATTLSGVLPVANGGTAGATKQAALNSLLGLAGLASGDLIRYDGANWSLKHTPGGVAAFLRADGTYAVPSLVTLTLGDTGLQVLNASWSFPHGLGAAPSIILPYLEAIANAAGYIIGERIPIGASNIDTASVAFTISADATNIQYSFNNAVALPHIIDKTALTVPILVSNANWRLRVKFAA